MNTGVVLKTENKGTFNTELVTLGGMNFSQDSDELVTNELGELKFRKLIIEGSENEIKIHGFPQVPGELGSVYLDLNTGEHREYYLGGNWFARFEGYTLDYLDNNFEIRVMPSEADNFVLNNGSSQLDSNYDHSSGDSIVSKTFIDMLDSRFIKQDGSVGMDVGYSPEKDGDVLTKGSLTSGDLSIRIPSEDPLIKGVLWNDNGVVRVSSGPVSIIRYYTTEELHFAEYDENFVIINTETVQSNGTYVEYTGNGGFDYNFDASSVTKIEVLNYGNRTSWVLMAYGCFNMTEFVVSATDESKVTNFTYAWHYCDSLTSFPELDVSSGTNFTYAWGNCRSLTSFPELDVSSGTNFSYAWHNCPSLTSFPQLDVSQGTDFSYAWNYCSSLTPFPELDVSQGTNFDRAWRNCSSLTSFPQLDVSKGTNFHDAWSSCFSLTSFPELDVSSGTEFNWAWSGCSSLSSFPELDVSSGTNFGGAWYNCSSLTSFPQLDVSSGTLFNWAWRKCSSLSSFPQLDVSSGTNFYYVWRECSSLTSFPQLDVSQGTDFRGAWGYCYELPECPMNYLNIPSGAYTSGACEYCCTG